MRHLAIGVPLCALVLVGCTSSGKKTASRIDRAPAASRAAAPADDYGPEAVNEKRVKRYDDEQNVDHRPLVVQVAVTHASLSYPNGAAAFPLRRGQRVVQLGERNGFYRVTTTPADGDPTLMGWVARFAFEAAPAETSAPAPQCTGTAVAVMGSSASARCAYVCNAARECGEARRCEAAILVAGPQDEPSYTTACAVSAPSAPPVVPSLFGAPHASDGRCPSGFAAAKSIGSLCYRSCQTDRDCPSDATCTPTKEARLCEIRG